MMLYFLFCSLIKCWSSLLSSFYGARKVLSAGWRLLTGLPTRARTTSQSTKSSLLNLMKLKRRYYETRRLFFVIPFLLRGKNLYLQIGVTIVDDNQWEPDEEFFLKLTMLQVWASLELICHHFVTIVNFCLLRLFWSTWSMMLQGHGNGEVKLGRTSIMEITILNDDGLFKSLRV